MSGQVADRRVKPSICPPTDVPQFYSPKAFIATSLASIVCTMVNSREIPGYLIPIRHVALRPNQAIHVYPDVV